MRNLSLDKKKGQVSGLAPAILALVFAGIVLVFGIVMAQSLTDTQIGTTQSGTITNESITVLGATSIQNITATTRNACGYNSWNASRIMNGSVTSTTNQTLVEGVDYVIWSNGSITNMTVWSQSKARVTYTYYWGGEACETGNLTVVGLGTFADFWEIIVLAIVITIVIGLLLVIFGGQQRR